MLRRKRNREYGEETVSYWQSYSDMMAAVMLVLLLILTFSMLESRRELEAEKKLFEEQTELIRAQQEKLDKIIGVKKDIIEALQNEFKNSDLAISIDDDTGAISFDSSLLFDPDQSELKNESKSFLNQFLPRYFTILMNEKYSKNVAEIIIEGHTAKYGEYMSSLNLSQERALAVAKYALADNSKLKNVADMEILRKMVTVNGRAWYDPVYLKNGDIDDKNSRRVEIKFRLKDEEMVQEMINILEMDD